jgi:hypothetical protein
MSVHVPQLRFRPTPFMAEWIHKIAVREGRSQASVMNTLIQSMAGGGACYKLCANAKMLSFYDRAAPVSPLRAVAVNIAKLPDLLVNKLEQDAAAR